MKKGILLLCSIFFLVLTTPTYAWLSGYTTRYNITLKSDVATNLQNFPRNITVDTSKLTQGDCDDLRITDTSDNIIPYDLIGCGSNQTVWIKPTSIQSDNSTVVFVYYGHATDTNGENVSGVWVGNYTFALLMTEGTGTLIMDSLQQVNFTTNGGWNSTNTLFTGTNISTYGVAPTGSKGFAISNAVTNDTNNGWTISGWFNLTYVSNIGGIMTKGNTSGSDKRDWLIMLYTDFCSNNQYVFDDLNGTESGACYLSKNTNKWMYITARVNSTGMSSFENGTFSASTTRSLKDTLPKNDVIYLMTHWAGDATTYYANGSIAMVTLSNTSRTNDWIKMEYDSVIKPDLAVYSEEETGGPAVNSISLSAPVNGYTSTNYIVELNYTPTFYNGNIANCSLWTNNSGTWIATSNNTSAVTNNSINTFSITFSDDRTYIWNVQCANSTYLNTTATSNRTITINAPEVLNILIDQPSNNSAKAIYTNWTFNGTVTCPTGNCQNVFVYPRNGSISTTSLTETSNDDFYDGIFGAIPSHTMNSSGSIRLVGDFSELYKSSNNPTLKVTGDSFDAGGLAGTTGWYNATNGYYYLLYQCIDSTGVHAICLANTTDLMAATASWNKGGIVLGLNTSNAWMKSGTFPGGVVWNPNTNVFDLYFGGYSPWSQAGYANFTGFMNGLENLKVYENAIFTNTSICESAGQEVMQVKNWIEGKEQYAIVQCSFASDYRFYLVNITNNRTQFDKLNGGVAILDSDDFGHSEIQASGILVLRFNSTHNIYYQPTGYVDGTAGAIFLTYSFNRVNWVSWNSGADIIPRGGTNGNWDQFRAGVNDWLWSINGKLFETYTGTNQNAPEWNISTARFNYSNSFYTSDLKDLGSSLEITTVTWTNTTCVGCNVGVQAFYSDNTTTFDSSSVEYDGSITLNQNARYIKYNMTMTGNDTDTPTFDSITINYIGSVYDYFDMDLITNFPYDCGLLNHTNTACSWSFQVNGTASNDYNILITSNSTEVSNTSSALNITITSLTYLQNLTSNLIFTSSSGSEETEYEAETGGGGNPSGGEGGPQTPLPLPTSPDGILFSCSNDAECVTLLNNSNAKCVNSVCSEVGVSILDSAFPIFNELQNTALRLINSGIAMAQDLIADPASHTDAFGWIFILIFLGFMIYSGFKRD